MADDVVDLCFKGVASRIQGASFEDLQFEQALLAKEAFKARKSIQPGGLLKYMHGQEYHAFNPDVINTVQRAVETGSYDAYKEYAHLVNTRPVATLRDLFGFSEKAKEIPLSEVEPVEAIFRVINRKK